MDHLDVKRILSDIDIPGRSVTFHVSRARTNVGISEPIFGPLYLQVQDVVCDRDTGRDAVVKGRKWLLSTHMTESEVVQTAFMALKAFDEHELRESFYYKGALVFNPHLDLSLIASHLRDGKIIESRRKEPNSLEREIPTHSPFYQKLLDEREGPYLEPRS